MKKKLKLYIRCLFSAIHIIAVKIFNIHGFSSGLAQDLSISTKITLDKGGKINLGKAIHTKKNVVIEAMNGGNIQIGNGCFLNNGCMIVSKEKITIGEKASFGPNVLIYDHDHDINRSEYTENSYNTSPVIIGKRVWIGANTVVLRGTTIGDNCIIGAGSVIKGNYDANTVIIQKRNTEIRKIIPSGGQEYNEGDDLKHGRTKQRAGFQSVV